jgi:ribose transport system ATP-binding protein
MTNKTVLQMIGIDKRFPGVHALKSVDFALQRGEIHALLGENGAGKSTLMKILCGVYQKDAGTILLQDEEVEFCNPREAQKRGISIIHQELNLIPQLSVAENIYLGREPASSLCGWIEWQKLYRQAGELLENLHFAIDPRTIVGTLSVGEQQMVEIAKALSQDVDVLVMDEPTAALTEREIERLFAIIRDMARKGISIIYISHRMEELFALCQRVTVMRDGTLVGARNIRDVSLDELVTMMVGRELSERFPARNVTPGEVVLSVRGLAREPRFYDINFDIRAGEVVGIAGLMGAGRTEVARAIFGADTITRGSILLSGKEVSIQGPADAINLGIGFISEDRKGEGLVLTLNIRENLTLANLDDICQAGFVNGPREYEIVQEYIERLNVKPALPEQIVRQLSGGNQQKVVIGKCLITQPKVLILDEPTRGVDVKAKAEIYEIINQLAAQGVAILMISSELPEILGLSDRILIMCSGRITGEFTRDEATQEKIAFCATGGGKYAN